MALEQILALLTPGQRDALIALATFEDFELAAAVIGVSDKGFVSIISKARKWGGRAVV